MIWFIGIVTLLTCLEYVHGVSVKINGIIDLGPEWNNQHEISHGENDISVTKGKTFTILETFRLRGNNIEDKVLNVSSTEKSTFHDKMVFGRNNPMNSNSTTTLTMQTLKPKTDEKRVTKSLVNIKIKEMYDKIHKVKDDQKVNEFTKHIYKQTLKVFDAIKGKVNNHDVKSKVDFLSRNYESKFREFIKETQDQNIKTRLGTQKVIMNTMDTSNRILSRLVNYLIGDMDRKGILRNNMAAANVVQKEVDKEIRLEYTHACVKFRVCRTENTLSKFLTDIVTIILKNDDRKLKQAADAFTEVLKTNDFSKLMDKITEKKFKQKIEDIEKYDVEWLRPAFLILRNIITHKNHPIVVMDAVDIRINKTVALLDIVDVLEKSMPGNEANTLEWNDMKNSLNDWSEGKRNDILEIMQTLVNHLKKTVDKLDDNNIENLSNCINIMVL